MLSWLWNKKCTLKKDRRQKNQESSVLVYSFTLSLRLMGNRSGHSVMLSPGSGSLPQPPGSMLWHALECEHTQNKKHKDKWLLHSHTNITCTYRDRHTWTLHKVSLPTYTSANRLSFPSHTLQHVPASNHVISFFPFLPPLYFSLLSSPLLSPLFSSSSPFFWSLLSYCQSDSRQTGLALGNVEASCVRLSSTPSLTPSPFAGDLPV